MKQPILVTGSNGLVASSFISSFGEKYLIEPVDISNATNPVDITNREAVARVLGEAEAKHILHFAAFTDVTAAWEQRGDKNGLAYKVNVVGTKNIAEEARKNQQHLIHISTAYVFDGEKEGLYLEDDPIHPLEWYGQTKAEAEAVIQNIADLAWTILRIDQPFKLEPFPKKDLAHRIIEGLQNDNLYPQFNNHFFGPTFLPDFARVLDTVISQNCLGLYHAASGEKWTDYDFASAIKDAHGFASEIQAGDLNQYLANLNRPYQKNTALNSEKLQRELKIEFTPIAEAITQLQY